MKSFQNTLVAGAMVACLAGLGGPASARQAPNAMDPGQVETIRAAIDEGRLLDAGRMIDEASMAGATDPRLLILTGQLGLARGNFSSALANFRSAEARSKDTPQVKAEALQGEGLALIAAGRTETVMPLLEQAVALAPGAWRAWNALGTLYDDKRDWARAEAAYAKALDASGGQAIVLNNRGYSRLLQSRLPEALPDFVAALGKQPDLAAARTNLRLALALQGDYARAMAGGKPQDEASLLNNVGFAAGLRGDYGAAEKYLQQALAARGEFYGRASANLKLFQADPQGRPQ